MQEERFNEERGNSAAERDCAKLQAEALQLRKDIVEMLYAAGSGHPGGSLSIAEILTDLYHRMRFDPSDPKKADRDRLVLSKGHAAPALYAVLAEHGFFSADEFKRLRKLGGKLQGHPDMNKTPGVDACTGSLGLGISTAVGMALASRVSGIPYQVYVIAGDGEMQEGIVWEALTAAVHYRLGNLTLILDRNGLQIDGATADVIESADLRKKIEAAGFQVTEADGNDFASLDRAYAERTGDRPFCIVANTVKGKGISFMENQVGWHGQALSEADYQKAMQELSEAGHQKAMQAQTKGGR